MQIHTVSHFEATSSARWTHAHLDNITLVAPNVEGTFISCTAETLGEAMEDLYVKVVRETQNPNVTIGFVWNGAVWNLPLAAWGAEKKSGLLSDAMGGA